MRNKAGIAIYQSNALFKGYCRPSYNFNFIKGTLHSQQKKIQRMNDHIILDGLHNFRCGSFCCVRVIFLVCLGTLQQLGTYLPNQIHVYCQPASVQIVHCMDCMLSIERLRVGCRCRYKPT